MQKARVLIVEDHALVQTGLIAMLSATPDLTVVGVCDSGDDALEKLRTTPCDVLLCDISLPGASGMELLARVRPEFPDVQVLIHSSYAEAQFGLNAMRAGAAGFINKGASAEELLRAVRAVARKQRYVSPALASLLVDGLDGRHQTLHAALSEREFSVLLRLAAGESATGIAEAFGISVKTVSTYRTRILEKMNLSTNADLTRYCLQHGLNGIPSET